MTDSTAPDWPRPTRCVIHGFNAAAPPPAAPSRAVDVPPAGHAAQRFGFVNPASNGAGEAIRRHLPDFGGAGDRIGKGPRAGREHENRVAIERAVRGPDRPRDA